MRMMQLRRLHRPIRIGLTARRAAFGGQGGVSISGQHFSDIACDWAVAIDGASQPRRTAPPKYDRRSRRSGRQANPTVPATKEPAWRKISAASLTRFRVSYGQVPKSTAGIPACLCSPLKRSLEC